MKPIAAVFTRKNITWMVLFIIAIILFSFNMGHDSLWLDEAYSYTMTQHNFWDIIRFSIEDAHPPLYYLMLRGFKTVFGNSEIALRFLSVIGMLCLISLGAGPLKRIIGEKNSYIYAIIVILTPVSITMSQDVRMYSWAAFFTLAAGCYGYLCIKEERRFNWFFFCFFTLCASYTHYYALFAAFHINAFIFIRIMRKNKSKVIPYLITAGITVLLYLPWLINMILYLPVKGNNTPVSWITLDDRMIIFKVLFFPFANKFELFYELHPLINSGLPLLFCLILAGYSFFTCIRNNRTELISFLGFSVTIYFLTLFTGLFVSIIYQPILLSRYMLICFGFYLLPVSCGIGMIAGKKKRIIILILFMALTVSQIYSIYTKQFNGPLHEVKEEIGKSITDDAVFIHNDYISLYTFLYYFPDNKHYMKNPREQSAPPSDAFFKGKAAYYNSLDDCLTNTETVLIVQIDGNAEPFTSKDFTDRKNWQLVYEKKEFSNKTSFYKAIISKYSYKSWRCIKFLKFNEI